MPFFNYQENQLHAENVKIADIVQQYQTPAYIYSKAAFTEHYQAYAKAMGEDDLVCYAVKANSNIAILQLLADLGAGFDIVSVGELERVLMAGGDPDKIVFSGVGKTADEMRRALEVGIHCFNVESAGELERLNTVAGEMNTAAPISIRVNPDVDAKTHPYISTGLKENKFGIHIDDALAVYLRAEELANIDIVGVDCHIGSQITDTTPFIDALERVIALVDTLAEHNILLEHIDLGGGLGVRYQDEVAPVPGDYIKQVKQRLAKYPMHLVVEPGRSIAANAGILVTKVEYLKHNGDKHFAIIDAAMNDMIRPALYQAWMEIKPVDKSLTGGVEASFDLVGPVCETGDFLGKDRPLNLQEGQLLAQFSAGAYGFTMASNYNSRPKAVEILVDGSDVHCIRERETFDDLVRGEKML